MANTTQLSVIRGDTSSWNVAVTLNGEVYPLTGSSLRFTVKRSPNDPDSAAVITRTSATGGVTITDGAAGKARITLGPADTTTLDPGATYVWDFQITTSGGSVYTPDGLRGPFTVSADVSRTTP